MKKTTAKIISVSLNVLIVALLFAGLLAWPEPASAGVSEWTPETIPGKTGNFLGPDAPGDSIDIVDYAIGDDNKTIYAVTGGSVTVNAVYKSADAGIAWTALPIGIRADMIAVAPDDNNIVVIGNNSTPEVTFSINGGATWTTLGTPQAAAPGSPAAVISAVAISEEKNGIHYIFAAGYEAGNTGNLWYFPYGQFGAAWQETNTLAGFAAQNQIMAVTFSPSFASDGVVAAVTGSAGAGVQLQVFDFTSLLWNDSAAYTDYPVTVINAPLMTGIVSASLALSPAYDGQQEDSRNLFIGLTLTGDNAAIAASGIYLFKDIVGTNILNGKQVHSLALSGSYLIAGLFNDTVVYRIQNPMAVTPTITTSSPTKHPGGSSCVVVKWMGGVLAAGTGGNESAFSISGNSGSTFTDISLIDTVLTSVRDVSVSRNGSKVYLITDDGIDTSLWFKNSGAWARVLSLKGTTDYVIRIETGAAAIIYMAQKGSANIYYNSGSGSVPWLTRICPVNVQDIAVESAQIVYVLNNAGKITKSINAGAQWSAAADTTLASGNMLVSAGANKLLAGSQNGYVAYSFDGNSTWKKIPKQFSALAGNMQVVPDQNFATNKTIYAATNTVNHDIMKWQIDASEDWADVFNGMIPGEVYGMGIDANTLYAVAYDPGTNQSTLWRFIAPLNATATSEGWTDIPTTAATDPDGSVRFNTAPQALKVSAGKLWAIKTNGTNKLYSLTDSVTDIEISLKTPAINFTNRINILTGAAADILFTWDRPSVATQYELRISPYEDFSTLMTPVIVTSSASVVSVFVGPNQAGPTYLDFNPGTKYYWKIRTTKPGYSLFSESRTFSIESLPVSPVSSVQMLSPANGAVLKDTTPAFSWQPLFGVTEYEFVLSENMDMSAPVMDAIVETTAIQIPGELEAGKTYYWQVRSIKPAASEWSPIGIFMVEAAIPPPTTETPSETPVKEPDVTITEVLEIPVVEQTQYIYPTASVQETKTVTPGYLVMSVFILIVITSSVIYLIIKRSHRRFAPAISGGGEMRPVRRQREPGIRPAPAERRLAVQMARVTPEAVLGIAKAPAEKQIRPVASIEKPFAPAVQPKPALPAQEKAVLPPNGKSKDAMAVIFAAKSFMWMSAEENMTAAGASDKEQSALGKKLAARIQELSRKEPLYIRHAEDAAMLLRIWARYGSRNETNRYLVDSLKARPENAVRLLKCFLPTGISPEAENAADMFNLDSYKAAAEVVDADKIYAALTRVSKFKPDPKKEAAPVKTADSSLAARFMHLHLQSK